MCKDNCEPLIDFMLVTKELAMMAQTRHCDQGMSWLP